MGELPRLSPELSPGRCLQKGRILAMLWPRVVLGQVTGCRAPQCALEEPVLFLGRGRHSSYKGTCVCC